MSGCSVTVFKSCQITVPLCCPPQGDYERPLRDGSPQVTTGDTYPRAPLKQPHGHSKLPGYPPAHLPYPPVFHHYKPSPYHHPPSQPSPPYTPQVQTDREFTLLSAFLGQIQKKYHFNEVIQGLLSPVCKGLTRKMPLDMLNPLFISSKYYFSPHLVSHLFRSSDILVFLCLFF